MLQKQWQRWSCGLVYFLAGNAIDSIWRVMASSQGISSRIPFKPQHSNHNPKPISLANQVWCIDFLTPLTPLIIPHRLPGFLESLMLLKNWCSIHARWSKSSLNYSIRFCGIFPCLKQNEFLLHVVLLKCPHVQIAFLKFTVSRLSLNVAIIILCSILTGYF